MSKIFGVTIRKEVEACGDVFSSERLVIIKDVDSPEDAKEKVDFRLLCGGRIIRVEELDFNASGAADCGIVSLSVKQGEIS